VSEKGIEESRITKRTKKHKVGTMFGRCGAKKETLRHKLLATMEENK